VDTLVLEENVPREIYLEGVDFPRVLVKQVFTNEDGSCGMLYLVSSAPTLFLMTSPQPIKNAGKWSVITSRSNNTSR
jgi:hypothetical protein